MIHRIRLHRTALLFAAAVCLLFGGTPSAQADTWAEVNVYQGTMFLSGGLGYPCTSGSTVNLANCTTPGVACGGAHATCVTGGNTRSYVFDSSVCVAAGYDSDALDPTGCGWTSTGTLTGACGMSSGLESWSQYKLYWWGGSLLRGGSRHWTSTGGTMVFTGTTEAGGQVFGVAQATPSAPAGSSCASGTATEFTVVGVTSMVAG